MLPVIDGGALVTAVGFHGHEAVVRLVDESSREVIMARVPAARMPQVGERFGVKLYGPVLAFTRGEPVTATPEIERVVGVPFGDLRRHGDRPALLTDGDVITYEQLADRVDDLAERLGGSRRLVLLRGGNSIDTVVAYLAALHARPPDDPGADRARPDRLDPWLATHDPDIVLDTGDGLAGRHPSRHQRTRAAP